MGTSDHHIEIHYKNTISKILNDLPSGSKIAWLGQKLPSLNKDVFLYKSIMSKVNNSLDHYFFDIENENENNSFFWNVHNTWDIKNYDLVLGLRIAYACYSKKNLIKNIKNVVKYNKNVIFDFTTASLSYKGKQKVFKKNNSSNTILPFFLKYYDIKDIVVIPNHNDQIVLLKDFSEEKIYFDHLLTFKDEIKNRFYSVIRFYNEI